MAPRKRYVKVSEQNEVFFEHGTTENIIEEVMRYNNFTPDHYQVFNTFTTDSGATTTRVVIKEPKADNSQLSIPDEFYVWMFLPKN